MNCPECNGHTRVFDTLPFDNTEIYRIRKCKKCNHTFYTYECVIDLTERASADLALARKRKKMRTLFKKQ